MGLRERNRRTAMRETQREAMRMFRQQGFAQVTVEEIATRLGMAASTVYRHFGSKEAIVLWDEHDAALDESLTDRLLTNRGEQSPFHALRDVFVDTLAERYEADLAFQLDRVGFIYETEALHAAAVEAQLKDRDELTAALRHVLTRRNRDAAPLLAGAAMLALDVAIERWQEDGGRQGLGSLIHDAFSALEHLDALR